MEANSIGQSGGADPPGQSPEENKSSEEVALIYAAMMEDLGIGRVDALPLDDRGGDRIHVHMPIQKQVEDNPNDPTARWRNLQFDDVTPADAGRDPMCHGQLHRLRRQAMEDESTRQAMKNGSNQQGPSGRGGRSLGRGRGGKANRGGNRGRGGSSRGAHSSANTERRSELTSPSGRTSKPFFNNARRGGMNRRARFGTSVTPHRAKAAGAQAAFARKELDELITQQRQRSATNAGPSGDPQERTAAPLLAIAGQDSFLPYSGLNKSTLATQERSRPSSPNGTSREDYVLPVEPPVVRLPQALQIVDNANVQSQQKSQHSADEKSAVIHNILDKESRPQTLPEGAVGLACSRWATPGAVDVGEPLAQAKPLPPVPKANTRATKDDTVHTREEAKISRDGCEPIRGIALLLENKSPDGTYFTLQLDVNGKTVLREDILDVDYFGCKNTVITYRPRRYANGSILLPSNTWQLDFLTLFSTVSFYRAVANVRNWDLGPDIKDLAQPITGSAAVAQSQQPMSVEQPTPRAASEQFDSLPDCDFRSTGASAGSGPMSISDDSEILDENVGPSGSARRPASSEWPMAQPITDRISVVLPDRYQSGGGHKISTRAYSETKEVADVEPLISFGHDDPEPLTLWFQTLLNMDDTELIQSAFDHFENRPDGPFLDQLSTMVAKENVPPTSRLTGEEVLSSVKYQEAAESLVGGYLCQSATFAKMPDMLTIQYTSEKARKVLEKAVAYCEGKNINLAPQPSPAFELSESGLSVLQYRAEPVMVETSNLPKIAANAENSKGPASRISYSLADLLSLRQNASRFKTELISGIPNPADRGELSRQPDHDNTRSPAVNRTTFVEACQAYSVTESGDQTEILRNLPTKSTDPTHQFEPVSAQKPAVQKSFWSNDLGPSTPVKTESVMTPPKLTNTSQTQETDMTLWNAILNAPKDTKQDPSRIRAFSKSKQQSPLASARDIGHVPINSECDRLASTLEGLALSKELNSEPSTLEVQPVPESDASIGSQKPPSLDRPPSTSSFAMYEKIKESLKSPLKLVSRPNSTLSGTPVPSVTGTAKSDTGSIPPSQNLATVEAASTQDLNVENPPIVEQLRKGVTAVPPQHPARYSYPEPSVNFLSPKVYLPTGHPQSHEVNLPSGHPQLSAQPSPTSPTAEVQSKIVVKAESERTQVSDPISTQIPNLETIDNKDLKGVRGLQSSRWASGPVGHAPAARAHPTRSPFTTPFHPHRHFGHAQQQTPQTDGNVYASPLPVHNPMVPMMSTPRMQENVPYSQQTPPVPNFGPRRGHKRNDSMATDLNFSPSSSPFTATEGRGPSAISPQGRTALSPVRQGENVQANLQSRPNSFLTGRPPNANE